MRRSILIATASTFALLAAAMQLHVQAQAVAPPPATGQVADEVDMQALSKELAGEAKRLQDDTLRRLDELGKLEKSLQDKQRDTASAKQNVDALIKLLRDAADRLAPDNAYRKTLKAEEDIIRGLARDAEASPDPELRKMIPQYRGNLADIGSMQEEAEGLRTRLTAQIDRLVRLRERMEHMWAASQIDAFIKDARAYLDHMKAIADGTQNLANGLDSFGRSPMTN
ncbi:MAG: hypothetical protein ACHQAQ_09710 [Hyphomicrobiales bacterium]